MTLYEQMIASEEYKKLFDQLPNDRKYIIQEDMRKFMDDVENKLINPIKTHMETLTKK